MNLPHNGRSARRPCASFHLPTIRLNHLCFPTPGSPLSDFPSPSQCPLGLPSSIPSPLIAAARSAGGGQGPRRHRLPASPAFIPSPLSLYPPLPLPPSLLPPPLPCTNLSWRILCPRRCRRRGNAGRSGRPTCFWSASTRRARRTGTFGWAPRHGVIVGGTNLSVGERAGGLCLGCPRGVAWAEGVVGGRQPAPSNAVAAAPVPLFLPCCGGRVSSFSLLAALLDRPSHLRSWLLRTCLRRRSLMHQMRRELDSSGWRSRVKAMAREVRSPTSPAGGCHCRAHARAGSAALGGALCCPYRRRVGRGVGGRAGIGVFAHCCSPILFVSASLPPPSPFLFRGRPRMRNKGTARTAVGARRPRLRTSSLLRWSTPLMVRCGPRLCVPLRLAPQCLRFRACGACVEGGGWERRGGEALMGGRGGGRRGRREH